MRNFTLLLLFLYTFNLIQSQPVSATFNSTGTYIVPSRYTANVTIQVWGGGGSGGGGNGTHAERSGGGGGAYASSTNISLTTGSYTVTVGSGGTAPGASGVGVNGNASSFTTLVIADGGTAGSDNSPGGAGGTVGVTGTTKYAGGAGGARNTNNNAGGGGGGGSANISSNGGAGSSSANNSGGAGGSGTGNGGSGGNNNGTASNGVAPGGGGGGKGDNGNTSGNGAIGRVIVTVNSFLPIQLESFEVKLNKKPELFWSTLAELNNDYFRIESSRDGYIFSELKRIKGAGSSDRRNEYRFTDQTPYAGTNYYRITQVDFDGTSVSYPIKSAVMLLDKILTYPSPFKDRIYIDLPQNDIDTKWIITNFLGQILSQGVIKQFDLHEIINLSALPVGPYLLTIDQSNKIESFKVLKF